MRAMNRRLLLSLIAALAASGLAAAVAYAKTYDVPTALGGSLERVDARTPLAILLPSRLALDYDGRAFASGSGASRSYSLSLAAVRGCGGATACFLATFGAKRGGTPSFRRRAALRGGRTGYFKPLTCGASCSPPIIEWISRGNLYSIQAKIPDATDAAQRRRMVAAANAAIGAGPR
jgi:hypothetical protein